MYVYIYLSDYKGAVIYECTYVINMYWYTLIRSAHESVWLVERKPIWLPRAYLTRGDLEPARGNLHVCKFLRDLTNIQIRTVMAEQADLFWVHLPDERVTTQGRKEGRQAGENWKEREKDGRKNEGKSEREGTANEREREKALDSIRPETNNSVLSWINTIISFLLPFTPALDNNYLSIYLFLKELVCGYVCIYVCMDQSIWF